jgi:capsule polysaccharide export protein KpsE/RkpR
MVPDLRAGAPEMALMAGLLGKAPGGAAGLASDLLGTGDAGAMFVGVLRSRTIAENLVHQFDLRKVYWARKDADAREKLAGRTDVSEERKSQIITITVTDRDPRRAADIARAYVDQLNGLLAQVNTSAAHRQRVFIDQRLSEVKTQLHNAAVQLSQFSAQNTTIDPKEQGRAMVGAFVTLQGELIALETQLRGLQQVYSDNNVRVRSTKARIYELKQQLEKIHGSDPAAPQDAGVDDEAAYPTFRKLPVLGVAYGDLFREVKLQEAIFETLTEQDELAKIEEVKEIPVVKVLDPADVPERKSGPPRMVIIIFGIFFSFAAGAAFVVGSRLFQAIDPSDPRKRFALEVLHDLRNSYVSRRRYWRRRGVS